MGFCLWTLPVLAAFCAFVDSADGTNFPPVSNPVPIPVPVDNPVNKVSFPWVDSLDVESSQTETKSSDSLISQPSEEFKSESEESSNVEDPWNQNEKIGPVATPRPDDDNTRVGPQIGEQQQFPFSQGSEIPKPDVWFVSKGPSANQFTGQSWIPVGSSPSGDVLVLAKTEETSRPPVIESTMPRRASPVVSNPPTETVITNSAQDSITLDNTRTSPSNPPDNQRFIGDQLSDKFPSIVSTKNSFTPTVFRILPITPSEVASRPPTGDETFPEQSQLDSIPKTPPVLLQPPLRNWIFQQKSPDVTGLKKVFAPIPVPIPQSNSSKPVQTARVVINDKTAPQIMIFDQPSNVGSVNEIPSFPDTPALWMLRPNAPAPIVSQQNLWYSLPLVLNNRNFSPPASNSEKQKDEISSTETPSKVLINPTDPPPSSDLWIVRGNESSSRSASDLNAPAFPFSAPKADVLFVANRSPLIIPPRIPPPLPVLSKYISPPPLIMNGSNIPAVSFGTGPKVRYFIPQPNYFMPSQPVGSYFMPLSSSRQTLTSQFSGLPMQYVLNDPFRGREYFAPPLPGQNIFGFFRTNTSTLPRVSFPSPVFIPPNQNYLPPVRQQSQLPYILPFFRSYTTSIQNLLGISGMPYMVRGREESIPTPAQPEKPQNNVESDLPQSKFGALSSPSVPLLNTNLPKSQFTEAPVTDKAASYRVTTPQAGKFTPGFPFLDRQVSVPVTIPKVETYNTDSRKSYAFGYDQSDELGALQHRQETADTSGVVKGSYGYRDALGVYRKVEYVADSGGYRAVVSNEPVSSNQEGNNVPVRTRSWPSVNDPTEKVIPAEASSPESRD